MDGYMKANGSKIKNKVEVEIFIQTGIFTLGNFFMVKGMERDSFNGQVERDMTENGEMVRNMDQDFGRQLKGTVMLVSGS